MRKTFLFGCLFALMVGGFAGCTASDYGRSGRLNSRDGRSWSRAETRTTALSV